MARNLNDMLRELPEERQSRIKARADQLFMEVTLHELRKELGLSQVELAEILKVSQASVSKQERQTDMQISTLCQIIHAMGGTLKVTASIPGKGEFKLTQFEECGQ
ncbi:XRE family transcriptional regulator [Maridesulfovibrio ferrireducens]|uniref:XRE family transcriptional regulator n=1 Tax=Maridesulfovibrio ferrireducens TaxID=246191 RepID=UPI001A1A48DB|nr:XRE family transcriptional regulator [Maridesulfovibrio ferrireducens]MBI9109640.1 XRE family transcriptional regulator [Maridesulfovibrio ferrireducens]